MSADATPSQAQIDAAVARMAEHVRRASPDPARVDALPYPAADAEDTRGPDGWREVGVVVDGGRGRAWVVRWHPAGRIRAGCLRLEC